MLEEEMKETKPQEAEVKYREGIVVAVDRQQYILLRTHSFDALRDVKMNETKKFQKNEQRVLRTLLLPQNEDAFNRLIKAIEGKYQIVDRNALITVTT